MEAAYKYDHAPHTTPDEMPLVFLLEDDMDLQSILTHRLQKEGYRVQAFRRAEDVLQIMDASPQLKPAAFVMDINLEGRMNGLEATTKLRGYKHTAGSPILMLTARGEAQDIVTGLNDGADDYLPKPFDMEVFLARLKSCVRRGERNSGPVATPKKKIHLCEITVDNSSHRVEVVGRDVQLTLTEFGLLSNLMIHPNEVLTRGDLLLRLMGPNSNVTDRTIDVHVRALRAKLGKKAVHVGTVRGVGYKFVTEA